MIDRLYTQSDWTTIEGVPLTEQIMNAIMAGKIVTVVKIEDESPIPTRLLFCDEHNVPRFAPLESLSEEPCGRCHSFGKIAEGRCDSEEKPICPDCDGEGRVCRIDAPETPEPLAPGEIADTTTGIKAMRPLIATAGEPVVIEPCANHCGKKVAIPAGQYNQHGRYCCAACAPVMHQRDINRAAGAQALGRAITETLAKTRQEEFLRGKLRGRAR